MKHARSAAQDALQGSANDSKKLDFPTMSFAKSLWHVGTMNKEEKKKNSHEGAGLSVSLHPDEWRRITPLPGRKHQLSKTRNYFLDFHEMSESEREAVLEWGEENGYAKKATIWRVTHFDDEMDCELFSEYESEEEAAIEAEGYEVEPEPREAYAATPALCERAMQTSVSPISVLCLLSTLYAEDVLGIDGVWWNDRLDVSKCSAPRGVIAPSKLQTWTIEKMQ